MFNKGVGEYAQGAMLGKYALPSAPFVVLIIPIVSYDFLAFSHRLPRDSKDKSGKSISGFDKEKKIKVFMRKGSLTREKAKKLYNI